MYPSLWMVTGDGRKQGKIRTFGHQSGVVAVRDTVEAAAELGINFFHFMLFHRKLETSPLGG